MKKKTWIPEVPKERILKLAKKVKPVVRFGLLGLCYIWRVDPFSVAFTWSPKPVRPAMRLKALCDITTYHSWAYYGFFKPSIAEVLAQIPEEHLDKVAAFEIVDSPGSAADLNENLEALNAGYHVATTRLYIRKRLLELLV